MSKVTARASIALASAAVRQTSTWHRGVQETNTCAVVKTSEATAQQQAQAMASADSAYDANIAASATNQEAARNAAYVTVQVVSPQGEKHPLKVRPSDDVSTLRALCTQVSTQVVCALASAFEAVVWFGLCAQILHLSSRVRLTAAIYTRCI